MTRPCDVSAINTGLRDISTSKSWPKLGDFRKLYHDYPTDCLSCSSQYDRIDTLTCNADRKCIHRRLVKVEAASGSDVKLGDFGKLRGELGQQCSEPCPDAFSSRAGFCNISQTPAIGKDCREEELPRQQDGDVAHMLPTSPGVRSSQLVVRLPTPPLNVRVDASNYSTSAVEEPDIHTDKKRPGSLRCSESRQTMPDTEILFYKLADQGPILPIFGQKLSLNQKHEALSVRLVPIRVGDGSIETHDHSVALNGVHIFLDMSNINISFQHALRHKYSIQGHSRFVPLPQLNLQFLTEILVRNRRTIALNASCSVPPNRHEPRFIYELRKLGYRVDLRERIRITGAKGPNTNGSDGRDNGSSDRLVALHSVARFMEDLVDETLQTRIAESVMEYFEQPGTLVLATGDARPAKHSDGFFMYAERALRMGWYVEVVSWNMSLSSRWRKSSLAQQWGHRFRLISLDDFLDVLLL